MELRVPDLGPAGESAATGTDIGEISRWIFREARHADDHDYDGWEALWTDDGVYWVPAAGPRDDPAATMSIIYDNRTRISTRIKQLNTGRRHSQRPVSSLRRVVSNLEVVGSHAGDVEVIANFVLVEWRDGTTETWAGRTTYRLRRVGDDLRMSYKRVDLVNAAGDLPTLSFLI